MNYNWQLKETSEEAIKHIVNEFNLPESIATIMAQRGIIDRDISRDFFYPDLNKLHDPFLMLGMEKAVNYIQNLIQELKKQKNLYDVYCGYCSIDSRDIFFSLNMPKVIFNKRKELIYISRAPIPSNKKNEFKNKDTSFWTYWRWKYSL